MGNPSLPAILIKLTILYQYTQMYQDQGRKIGGPNARHYHEQQQQQQYWHWKNSKEGRMHVKMMLHRFCMF